MCAMRSSCGKRYKQGTMNSKLHTILISFFIVITSLAFARHAQAAPSLQFAPASQTVVKDSLFDISIAINVESQQTFGADAVVTYAGADLEVVNVTNGGFFPQFNKANTPTGKLELHGYFSSLYESRAGNGTFATITFRAKNDSGSSTISYVCTGSGVDTQILNTSGTNILSCANLNMVSLTYSGSGATPTNTPTTTTTTNQAQANIPPVCTGLSASPTAGTGVPLAVTFTCSGTDEDGNITGAEFIFGDRTSQTVPKAIGDSGSISITHTYTQIGSLGASCRMFDSNNAYSGISSDCKKIIKIAAGKSQASSGQAATPTPSKKAGATATPTPTLQVVSIIADTPSPTIRYKRPQLNIPQQRLTEDEQETPKKNPWVIVAIAAAALGLIILILKRKPPRSNAPPPITSA